MPKCFWLYDKRRHSMQDYKKVGHWKTASVYNVCLWKRFCFHIYTCCIQIRSRCLLVWLNIIKYFADTIIIDIIKRRSLLYPLVESNKIWKCWNETLLRLNDRNTISIIVRRAQFVLCRDEMIEKFDKGNISNWFSRIFVKKIDRPHFSVLSFKTRVCIKTFHVLRQNFNARQGKSFMHSLSIFRYVG